jgi:hypothetical protein
MQPQAAEVNVNVRPSIPAHSPRTTSPVLTGYAPVIVPVVTMSPRQSRNARARRATCEGSERGGAALD